MAKHFRVSERPVILAMGELTRFMNEVKTSGKELGFQYPENPPLVQLLGPRKVQDWLAYKQLPTFSSPFPQISDILKGTKVSAEDRATIAANLSSLEEKSGEQARALALKFGNFMDQISTGVNRLDSFLGFHLDLFAHCDGEVSERMRERPLFSSTLRSGLQPGVQGSPLLMRVSPRVC